MDGADFALKVSRSVKDSAAARYVGGNGETPGSVSCRG
jgi:hypothetical protein